MKNADRALLVASFRRVLTVTDLAIELFSGRLRLRDPALFDRLDAGARPRQLDLVRLLAQGFDEGARLDVLTESLEALARRGVREGVEEAHYDVLGETLLWTLQQVLGDGFTPPVAAAWGAAVARVVERLQQAAAAQARRPVTLRRLRRASYPELEAGRLAELPPPSSAHVPASAAGPSSAHVPSAHVPASARVPTMPLSSRLTPVH